MWPTRKAERDIGAIKVKTGDASDSFRIRLCDAARPASFAR
jgi:hypothetical protein